MHLRHLADQALHQRQRQFPDQVHLRLGHEGETHRVRRGEDAQTEHQRGLQSLSENQTHDHLPDLRFGADRRRHQRRRPGGHGRAARRGHLRLQLPGFPRPEPVGRAPHHQHRLDQRQSRHVRAGNQERLRDQLRRRVQHPGRPGGDGRLLPADGHSGALHLHRQRFLRRPARHAPRSSQRAGMRPVGGVHLQRTARQIRHSPAGHRRLRFPPAVAVAA
ncbi:hypothetical protein SDC9_153623 [bioreactor metagenome]|uniref:Uncharacterized protein n=1 Tax=bioreactor metagenome TaxID=1076179 RepID=A0A645EWV8_9ZZZZ